jgi:ribonucleotide reductase alpha subunit
MDESTFLDLYYSAWKLGLKTVYYFRNFTKEEEAPKDESCESCQA